MNAYHTLLSRVAPTRRLVTAAAIGLAATAGAQVAAQDAAAPAWLDVSIVQVRPGHAPDFEPLVRELMQARQEAGLPAGEIFEVVSGRPGEYHFVAPVATLAERDNPIQLMEPAEGAIFFDRLLQHVESARFFLASLNQDAMIDGGDAAASAELLLLRTITVVPGKEAEYEGWVVNDLVPALRQAQIPGHTFARGVFGDSPNNFYHASPVPNWAAFERDPLLESLGERAYTELLDRVDGLVQAHHLIVARPRPDLMPGN